MRVVADSKVLVDGSCDSACLTGPMYLYAMQASCVQYGGAGSRARGDVKVVGVCASALITKYAVVGDCEPGQECVGVARVRVIYSRRGRGRTVSVV